MATTADPFGINAPQQSGGPANNPAGIDFSRYQNVPTEDRPDPFGLTQHAQSFDETPAGITINTIRGVLGWVPPEENPWGKVAAGVGQAVARFGVSGALTAGQVPYAAYSLATGKDKITDVTQPIPIENPVLQAILGPQPLTGWATDIQDMSDKISQSPFAKRFGLDKFSMPLAFAGVVGGEGLNFAGGEGAAAKQAGKQAIKVFGETLPESLAPLAEFARQFPDSIAFTRALTGQPIPNELVPKDVPALQKALDEFSGKAIGPDGSPFFNTQHPTVLQRESAGIKNLHDFFDAANGAPKGMPFERIQQNLATSGGDWDMAIKAGDIPREQIYRADGSFTPAAADHVVSDLAEKLDHAQPGLGTEFKKIVNISNPTRENLVGQAQSFAELKRVASNLQKNNIGLPQREADAIAKDVIQNRKFNTAAVDTAATDLHNAATAHQPEFKAAVDRLAGEIGVKAKIGPVKKPDRIAEKAANDYNGDVTQVRDANRATVLVDHHDEIPKVVQAVEKHVGQTTRVKNGFETAANGQYKSAIINVKTAAGHEAEIQVTTPAMLAAKDSGGHDWYKIVRGKLADWEWFDKHMSALYETADQAAARAASGSEISVPSARALKGEYGRPVDTTVPQTSLPSESIRTTVPPTSKNLGNESAIPRKSSTAPSSAQGVQGGVDKAAQEAASMAAASPEVQRRNALATLMGVNPSDIGRMLTEQEIGTIAHAQSLDEIANVLRRVGYSEDIVRRFTPELFGMNPSEINDALNVIQRMDSLQKTSEAVDGMLKLQDSPQDAVLALAQGEDGKSWTSLIRGYVGKAKPNAKAHFLDYLSTPEFVLERLGLGKPAEMLHDARDAYLKTVNAEFVKIKGWQGRVARDPYSARLIFQYLDGEERLVARDMTNEQLAVAREIRTYLSEWADRLKLPQDGRISRYITHIFERTSEIPLKDGPFDDPELAALMSDHAAKSVYEPFLQNRLGKEGYIQDVWRALDAYVKRASRKEAMDPALEALEKAAKSMDELTYKYVATYTHRINMRPTELEKSMDSFITQTPIGHYFTDRPVAFLTGKIRGMFYRGTLGLNFSSALRNLSQGANTYAKLGEKYTIIGYGKLMGRLAARDLGELYDVGVLADSFVQDRPAGVMRQKLQSLDKGLFAMFELAEKINRGSAYFGAKSKGLAEGLSEEQAIKYAKRMVRETQFAFGAVDTPVALNDDVIKTLTQLQTYNIKQLEFFTRMVKNKEFGGMIRWTASSLAFMYTIGRAFNMTANQLIPTIGFGGAPFTSTLFAAGGLTSSDPQTHAKAANQLRRNLFTTIPGGAQLLKSTQGLAAYDAGKDTTATGKFRYRVDQTPENLIRVLLFGKYALPAAQDYFDKKSAGTSGAGASPATAANPFGI